MLFSLVSEFPFELRAESALANACLGSANLSATSADSLTVCNANILWHEPPKSNLDVVKDAFWDYVAKATLTAEESLTQIRQSELGQEVK